MVKGTHEKVSKAEEAKPRKRKQKQWQATVDLPRGQQLERSKPLVIRYAGQTEQVDSLQGLPLDGLEPGRHFVSRATSRNNPNRPYLYNRGQRISVESETEAIESHLRDRDPNVRDIIPQGAWIRCLKVPLGEPDAPARWGWSCVDFIIGYRDGTVEAVEVKRFDYEFKKRPAAKLLATARTCADIGLRYRIMAGLSRREWLAFYQLHSKRGANYRCYVEQDRLRIAMTDLAAVEPVTFDDLRSLGDPTVTASLIWELLWHGLLCIDWNQPIISTSPIRRHGPPCEHARENSAWDFRCGPQREDMLPALIEWAAQW